MPRDPQTVLRWFQKNWDTVEPRYDLMAGFLPISDDASVPRRGQLTLEPTEDGKLPRVELGFAVDSPTQARCTRLAVEAEAVNLAMIEKLRLSELLAAVVCHHAVPYDSATGRGTIKPHPEREKLFRYFSESRTRTQMTSQRLQHIADVYKQAVARGSTHPTEDVAAAENVERSTAAKYVMRARKAGLLPATTQGKVRG